MFLMIYFYIIISIINHIISTTDSLIVELEKRKKTQIQLDDKFSKIIYLVAKNDISGTYTYNVESPYMLELSFGKSEKSNIIPNIFEGHYEKNRIIKGYFYSISVSVKDDNKFTFVKILYNDGTNNLDINNNILVVNLVENYSASIGWFCFFFYMFFIFIILMFCTCGRSFLNRACDFTDLMPVKKNYEKIQEIYELNVIDIE